MAASAYASVYESWKICEQECESNDGCGCGAIPEYYGPESLSKNDTDPLHAAFSSGDVKCNGTYQESSDSVYQYITNSAELGGKVVAYRNEEEAVKFFFDAGLWKKELIDEWIVKYESSFTNNFVSQAVQNKYVYGNLFNNCINVNPTVLQGTQGSSINTYAGLPCKNIAKEFWQELIKKKPELAATSNGSCTPYDFYQDYPGYDSYTYSYHIYTCDALANCVDNVTNVVVPAQGPYTYHHVETCSWYDPTAIVGQRLQVLIENLDGEMREAIHYCLATAPKSAKIQYPDSKGSQLMRHPMSSTYFIDLPASTMSCSDVVAPVISASEAPGDGYNSGGVGELVYKTGIQIKSWSEADPDNNYHCLPQANSMLNCLKATGGCPSTLVPHQPQRGCGGVRARLDCAATNVSTSTNGDLVPTELVQ
jgi:hypothetical protein